jgi:hypothetical protein
MIDYLKRDGYHFSNRFYALKGILRQLIEDLKPDTIEKYIYQGQCDVCQQGR